MPIHKSGQRPQDAAPIKIDPNQIHWEENCVNDVNRLLAHVMIGSSDFHLEAIAVRDKDDGTDEGCDDICNDLLNEAYALAGDGPFERMEIDGREYVVFMTPYQG